MNPVATRSTRDTAFAGVAIMLSGIVANRAGLTSEEAAAVNLIMFGAITFGYRLLRHLLPWITDE